MVPGLRPGAFHFIFISWRYKKFLSCALAGYTGFGHYSLQDIRFGEAEAETSISFDYGIKVRP
jgi:hypothetical protein